MKNCRTMSNNDLDCHSPRQLISPHPPSEPCNDKNEATMRNRQRRYRHQSSEQRLNDLNLDVREIRSAGSNSILKVENLQSRDSTTKISSAPSPRTRTFEYRSSNFRREKSTGLYTFDSVPSLVQDQKDVNVQPRLKRKEQIINDKTIPSIVGLSSEPDLPPITISRSIKPCKSQASPVTSDNQRSLLLVKRQSLQQMSREKMSQLSKLSIQKSDIQNDGRCLGSPEYFGNEPINLNHYRSPNDVSDSFEAKMLASMVAESAHVENANNSSSLNPSLLHSKNFSAKITPRTEAMIGSSYSDDESSATTTGPLTNRLGAPSSQRLSVVDQNGMHNEWKRRFNLSQDTYRSIDVQSTITDSCCLSATTDDNIDADHDGYILVHYIPDLDCYIEPKTGICYESTL